MKHGQLLAITFVLRLTYSGQAADDPPPLLLGAAANGICLYNASAVVEHQLAKIAPGLQNAGALDYWLKEKTIVWADVDAHTLHIWKYDGSFEGKGPATVFTNNVPHVDGVAIDWVHGLLFRTDYDLLSIFVADLRSMRERVLLSTDLEAPRAIAVDPSSGVIFWSDWGTHRIERAGMDGQDRKVIASGDQVYWPNGLTLDLPARRVYWVEANGDTTKKGIYSSDYWGRDVKTVTQSVTFSNPYSIAVYGDWLYWTEVNRHQVLKVSKEGGHVSMFTELE
ncbi:Protein T13C2.6 a [Aphelenchoides avenae]|nr:Protein T13C2.6 a [Aphelenchus avenae]